MGLMYFVAKLRMLRGYLRPFQRNDMFLTARFSEAAVERVPVYGQTCGSRTSVCPFELKTGTISLSVLSSVPSF